MTSFASHRILTAGDGALVVEFGDGIDRAVSARVHALDEALSLARVEGVIETVPTFRSLMIHYEPAVLDYQRLVTTVEALVGEPAPAGGGGRAWVLPICYEPDMAPDLAFVAARAGLSPEAVVEAHASLVYHVYMLGFLPGQAYMGDNPPALALPRRETPRLAIPPGSLAIAMGMTSIFPLVTPCGWHLIGRCPVPMWDRDVASDPLLRAGDSVSFRSVDRGQFQAIASRLATERPVLTPRSLADLL